MKALGFGMALVFVGVSAFASLPAYEVEMKLSRHGKVVASPRLRVIEGERALISEKNKTDSTKIELVAKEGSIEGQEGILMNFQITSKSRNGRQSLVSRPTILAFENEPASISVGDDHGNEQFTLSVNVKRVEN